MNQVLILVTNKLMSTNEKRMSVTTKVILAAEEVITASLKNIEATNKLMISIYNSVNILDHGTKTVNEDSKPLFLSDLVCGSKKRVCKLVPPLTKIDFTSCVAQ